VQTADAGKPGTLGLANETARFLSGLLDLLAKLPSTPEIIAAGAEHHLADIETKLPSPYHTQVWERDSPHATTVELDVEAAREIIELLELFGELPSTPPGLAIDARHQADEMRRQLERTTGRDE
jgi:hypothetical protein